MYHYIMKLQLILLSSQFLTSSSYPMDSPFGNPFSSSRTLSNNSLGGLFKESRDITRALIRLPLQPFPRHQIPPTQEENQNNPRPLRDQLSWLRNQPNPHDARRQEFIQQHPDKSVVYEKDKECIENNPPREENRDKLRSMQEQPTLIRDQSNPDNERWQEFSQQSPETPVVYKKDKKIVENKPLGGGIGNDPRTLQVQPSWLEDQPNLHDKRRQETPAVSAKDKKIIEKYKSLLEFNAIETSTFNLETTTENIDGETTTPIEDDLLRSALSGPVVASLLG